jgi:hypothetical protein
VKLLRAGGAYLEGRARQHGARHLWIVTIGVSAAIIVGLLWHPLVGLVPLLFAMSQARPVYRKVGRFRAGIAGEQDVTRLLAKLPDDYVVVNDVVLPGQRGNIDHVVLGPCGIVVIETKRYGGAITCRQGRWFQNGRPIRNVGRQANHGALALREFLRREHPELETTTLRWVDSILVFAHPLCRLTVDRPGITSVRFSELLDALLAKGQRRRLSTAVVKTLAHTLVREARVRDLSA